jgi:hypothetical protein
MWDAESAHLPHHNQRFLGGGDGPGLFELGGELDHAPVAIMMGIIIVFTIFCEQVLAFGRKWVTHFNPLLHPCIDKVVAELMILGACAFSILLINELTGYSLSNGSFMPVMYYNTLHWIDTTIFVFAIFFVLSACLMLASCQLATAGLSHLDAPPPKKAEAKLNESSTLLTDEIAKDLESHCALSPGEPWVPTKLPHTSVEKLVRQVSDNSHNNLESGVTEFLCSGATHKEFVLQERAKRHMIMLMQPLVDLDVLTCVSTSKRPGCVTVSKHSATDWSLERSAPPGNDKAGMSVAKFVLEKQLQYKLLKHHFLRTFFGNSRTSFDFAFYIELVLVYGITGSFEIGVSEWTVLVRA